MRTCLLLLSLTLAPFALEPKDLHGMWRGTLAEDPTSQVEIFYGTDGRSEMRVKTVFLGIAEARMQGFGTWSVKGDSVYMRVTGGWAQLGEEDPEPIEADPAPVGEKTTLIPGNPKRIRMEDCEDGECAMLELAYAGAAQAFTLPTVGSGVSIRAARARVETAKGRPGRMSLYVLKDGRAFDPMGRPAR